MNSIRVKFVRGEEVKYISHLDLMKLFERTIRRSNVPIAYSQGFNPHPQMVFGLPLSVGVTSEAEYADFELLDRLEPAELIEKLNAEFPKGLKIVDAKEKLTKSNIMASIIMAVYEIMVSSSEKMGITDIRESIQEFIKKKDIFVEKDGKSGLKSIDIKPMIGTLDAKIFIGCQSENSQEIGDSNHDICSNRWILDYFDRVARLDTNDVSYTIDNMFCLSAKLSAGSKANLKPDLLVSAINLYTDMDLKLVKVHRTGLYIEKGGMYLDPLDEKALL